jgi:predicted amidophosphoribosyltransferase
MARFLCPTCQQVVNAGAERFAFCSACGTPLTIENVLAVQLIRTEPDQPYQEVFPEPAGS